MKDCDPLTGFTLSMFCLIKARTKISIGCCHFCCQKFVRGIVCVVAVGYILGHYCLKLVRGIIWGLPGEFFEVRQMDCLRFARGLFEVRQGNCLRFDRWIVWSSPGELCEGRQGNCVRFPRGIVWSSPGELCEVRQRNCLCCKLYYQT